MCTMLRTGMKHFFGIYLLLNIIFVEIIIWTSLDLMRLIDVYDDEKSYEKWINDYMSNIVPGLGELGEPAYVLADEEDMAKEIIQKNAVNLLLSNKISLDRRLPDVRHPQCRNISYDIANLPSASVVIIFHNEGWSVLVRTIHSVLRESPAKLLKEIILVDDANTEEELKGTLTYYIKTRLPSKVTIVRLPNRQGLIRAKMEGAKRATGEVLIFIDAHCEFVKGWMEPLLQRIKEKRNAVVQPLVDFISYDTFSFVPQISDTRFAGFSWKGDFIFVDDIPSRKMRAEESPTSPLPTATMIGGMFAIDRKYFWEFGSYDDQMTGWGAENLEMSFRTWQCGGSLEVIPCSRAGHVFRDFFPYKMPSESSIFINLARTVNVWMDEYSRLFYLFYDEEEKIGDIQNRLELRKRLKCKSFKWYLENIYPEKFILDENVTAHGTLRSSSSKLCLGWSIRFNLRRCKQEILHQQYFALTNLDLLRTEFACVGVRQNDTKVIMHSCESSREDIMWKLSENGSLVHLRSGLCLDAIGKIKSKQEIRANACNGSPGQIWEFEHYKNNTLHRR